MNYDFYPELIIRTPLFSVSQLFQETDFLSNPYFKEALFIASPDLVNLIYSDEHLNSKELSLSMTRYFNRMCFRCTPFGLFAGCSVAGWGNESKLVLSDRTVLRRSRPDKDFLSKIITEINQLDIVFKQLKVSVNNTLYAIGKEYRIIERGEESGEFRITSLAKNEALSYFIDLIAGGDTNVASLIKKGQGFGFSEYESLKYLKMLMKNQVIAPGTDKALTTNKLLAHLEDFLSGFDLKVKNKQVIFWKKFITELRMLLVTMDENVTENDTIYRQLVELAGQSGISQPSNRLIQVDYTHQGSAGTVSYKIKKTLQKGIDILGMISVAENDNHTFEQFKKRFLKKYEFQEIPLLLALDPEAGIDYMEGTSSFDDFLSKELVGPNLKESGKRPDLSYNLKLIVQKYEQAIIAGENVIELSDDDLNHMEKQDVNLPTSTSIFFRLFGKDNVQIENTGGSSGVNLFTRFTDFDKELYRIAKEVTGIEQHDAGECIIAEVIHEPEPRSANVNVFPPLRKYVIPYFSTSSIDPEYQIPLNDLLLSVKDGRLILRSVRLNKIVIPKISSAYNYLKGSPLFRFLGDAQNQGFTGLQFDFQKIMPGKKFYPRLSYKNIVFSPATWKIDLKELLTYDPSLSFDKVQAFLKSKKMPQYFIISEGDNELLIDIEQEQLITLWVDLMRKRKVLLIKEFLFDKHANAIRNEKGDFLNNQMIAILINKNATGVNQPKRATFNYVGKFQRNFSLGSEWLYYKIYCGIVSADKLLASHICHLFTELKKRGLIKSAFFIRYHDPDPHLRLRFLLRNTASVADVIMIVRQILLEPEQSGQIWKIQTDTYSRELERYGAAMVESEKIFAADSTAILNLLNLLPATENADTRFAIGIRMTSDLLNAVDYSLDKKIQFAKKMKSILKADCNIGSETDKKINTYYRENGLKCLEYIFSSPAKYERVLKQRYLIITRLFKKSQIKCQDAGTPNFIDDLLASHIHMSINRLFADNQKVYEYIVYEYLFKFLSTEKNKMNI